MSSADQPSTTAQTAAQATVEPTMVPSPAGTSATSIMPRLNPITIDESTILRQLNNITINMKLRDNMLYQTASPSLLNLYDHFSSVAFLANSTPPNRPITKHISDFINNIKPTQRTSSTAQATEWYICLAEEEHQHYQQYQQLMMRPLTHHQQQRPRLHSDSISAINYLIYYVASTATATSETILPNVPDDASLFLYSFVLVTTSSASWVRCNRRAGFQELEPATGATIAPTSEWGDSTTSWHREDHQQLCPSSATMLFNRNTSSTTTSSPAHNNATLHRSSQLFNILPSEADFATGSTSFIMEHTSSSSTTRATFATNGFRIQQQPTSGANQEQRWQHQHRDIVMKQQQPHQQQQQLQQHQRQPQPAQQQQQQ